jgi:ribosomal protein S18 acetylase RimI-like enzyme
MNHDHALAEARGFERAMTHALAGQIRALPFGRLVLARHLPEVYDLNLVVVDAGATSEPREVLEATERELDAAGAVHRKVRYEDGDAMQSAAPTFAAAGWERADDVVMVHDGARQPPWPERASLLNVQQFSELRRRLTRDRPWFTGSEDLLDTFQEYGRRSVALGHGRVVGVLDHGRAVASAHVYGAGKVRQIEEVEVESSHHGQGLGRILLDAAVHLAAADEPDLLFLTADAHDWPMTWYARHGFRAIGRTGSFYRMPRT